MMSPSFLGRDGVPIHPIVMPDAILDGPLPWFLEEPSTHPEAAALVEVAQRLLIAAPGTDSLSLEDVNGFRLQRWGQTASHVRAGLGIWSRGKCVLLASVDGEVWLYHAGAEWQDTLWKLAGRLHDRVNMDG